MLRKTCFSLPLFARFYRVSSLGYKEKDHERHLHFFSFFFLSNFFFLLFKDAVTRELLLDLYNEKAEKLDFGSLGFDRISRQ